MVGVFNLLEMYMALETMGGPLISLISLIGLAPALTLDFFSDAAAR
jgi:hypothetical protein